MEDGTMNVVLHISKPVWKRFKVLSIKEDTTIGNLASEALLAYVTWLWKAEKENETIAERAAREEELAVMEMELQAIRMEKAKNGLQGRRYNQQKKMRARFEEEKKGAGIPN